MRTRSKLLLAGLTAMLVLATAVSTASADQLAVNDQDFLAIWERLSFAADSGQVIHCGVTLLGSFHSRTISKVAGSLIGHITHADVDACEGDGNATILTETLPWHLTYAGFFEELPEIEGVNLRLIGAAFRVEAGEGLACLARTEVLEPAGGIANVDPSTGQVDSIRAEESFQIDLPGFLCGFAGDSSFSGVTSALTTKDGELLFISLV